MRFLVDAQLRPALARWIATQGHTAEHVADIGMLGATDIAIWDYAKAKRAIIVTKDEDFAVWRSTGSAAYPIVAWLRIGNMRKVELFRWLEPLWPELMKAIEKNETLVEIR